MSIVVSYDFWVECSEPELVAKLQRIGRRAKRLRDVKVKPLRKIDPVFNPLLLRELGRAKLAIPPAVWERVEDALEDKTYTQLCIILGLTAGLNLPARKKNRFFGPLKRLVEKPALWDPRDYPEEFAVGSSTYSRHAIMLEFVNAMERYGYALVIDPGEGSESVVVGLTTYRCHRSPLWTGNSFTKTQYATHFVPTHENVCRVLDFAAEEGILLRASDVCKFYEHRDWSRSAPLVNQETAFIEFASALIGRAVASANEQGAQIELIDNPIQRSKNYVCVSKKGKPRKPRA